MNEKLKFSVFWYYWLMSVISVVMLISICMIIMPNLTIKGFSLLIYSQSNTIESSFSSNALKYIELTHAVLGAVMFGWSILLLLILVGPFRKGNLESWYYMTISIVAWFVSDTLFSISKGFWQNAILNSFLFILLIMPLLAVRKEFIRN